MERLLRFVFLAALVLLGLGWFRQDHFVELPVPPRVLFEEPRQSPVREPGFEVRFRDMAYQIHPRYAYDLVGLVVSYRFHDGDRRLHRLWNDHLNVADLCVIWGENVGGPDLNRFDFFNGQFTCNVFTRDRAAWARFDPNRLSNNHLVTDRPDLRERIGEVRVGDVVRVRGRLVHYGNAGEPAQQLRQTSTTRTDTGNGACETIYVRDFEILDSMPNPWRRGVAVGGWVAVLSGGLWLLGVATGRLGAAGALRR